MVANQVSDIRSQPLSLSPQARSTSRSTVRNFANAYINRASADTSIDADLSDKPFFAGLVKYMNSGPIAAIVFEGRDAVKTGRVLLGATNPLASNPGTIRGDFAIDVGR